MNILSPGAGWHPALPGPGQEAPGPVPCVRSLSGAGLSFPDASQDRHLASAGGSEILCYEKRKQSASGADMIDATRSQFDIEPGTGRRVQNKRPVGGVVPHMPRGIPRRKYGSAPAQGAGNTRRGKGGVGDSRYSNSTCGRALGRLRH